MERLPQIHGPITIPFVNMHGKEEGTPHDPGIYGRYLAIDLDQNNRTPRGVLGWGVCRQGFGLQALPRMNKAQAEAKAKELNERMPIGIAARRFAATKQRED
jgi:hypothetical protein